MSKRPMPKDKEAARLKAEADSLGEHHMAVARNKAKESLARGNAARSAQQALKGIKNPFNEIAKKLKGT